MHLKPDAVLQHCPFLFLQQHRYPLRDHRITRQAACLTPNHFGLSLRAIISFPISIGLRCTFRQFLSEQFLLYRQTVIVSYALRRKVRHLIAPLHLRCTILSARISRHNLAFRQRLAAPPAKLSGSSRQSYGLTLDLVRLASLAPRSDLRQAADFARFFPPNRPGQTSRSGQPHPLRG